MQSVPTSSRPGVHLLHRYRLVCYAEGCLASPLITGNSPDLSRSSSWITLFLQLFEAFIDGSSFLSGVCLLSDQTNFSYLGHFPAPLLPGYYICWLHSSDAVFRDGVSRYVRNFVTTQRDLVTAEGAVNLFASIAPAQQCFNAKCAKG